MRTNLFLKHENQYIIYMYIFQTLFEMYEGTNAYLAFIQMCHDVKTVNNDFLMICDRFDKLRYVTQSLY
jgi:hypothetical protein